MDRFILTILLLGPSAIIAEAQSYSIFDPNMSYSTTRYNDSYLMGKKITETLNYSDVKGNCFWNSQWNPAVLILKSREAVKLKKAKLDFYSNQIQFLGKSGDELFADVEVLKVIFFDPIDSTKAVGAFLNSPKLSLDKTNTFGQILNDGKIQLIKTSPTTITTGKDPFSREIVYLFQTVNHYFILNNGEIKPLPGKGISQESIFSIIKPTDHELQWLKSNKNKLRNEKDATEFLSFCNNR